jgi:alkylation response protein AidB-like acyl-CoA dehydrogenase
MDFERSAEHRGIQETIREFGEREIKPHAGAWDRDGVFPADVIRRLGELGFMGVVYPEEYGGSGADTLSGVLVVEGLARYDASVALTVASHTSLATGHIFQFGSEEQRRRYLPDMVSGRKLGAWCLTEAGAGSDAARITTRAVRSGKGWVLTGSKMFITQGSVADVYVVLASTAPEAGRRGLTAFIVERGTLGLGTGRKIEKLGLRASDTAEVILDQVGVPAASVIGEVGTGYRQALAILDGARIGMAAFCLGIGRGALEEACAYAQQRTQFGRPIAELQAIQWMLADMATRLDAARLLMYRAAYLRDAGQPYRTEAAMAKLLASEAAMAATIKAVQIHGGYGYMCDYPVERYMRDAKLGEIGEGTSEVQRMVIARQLLQE